MVIGTFIKDFIALHLHGLRQGAAVECYTLRYLAPFYDRTFPSITSLEVVKWHRALGVGKPQSANRALSVLRTVFNKAREWGVYVGPNPCAGVHRFPSRSRTRFLNTADELTRFFLSLSHEAPLVRAFFLLLITSCCRSCEAKSLRWRDLSLTEGVWTKPLTKNGDSQRLPLPAKLVAELQALPHTCEYVFATNRGKPWGVTKMETLWMRVRARAGLDDVHLHDLRRTGASLLARQGVPLHVIAAILNHRDFKTTAIYVRGVSEAPIVRASLEQLYANMVQSVPPG